MQINGHMLSGKMVGGRWVWTCPSWPDLAGLHSGKTDAAPMVEEFTGRAMKGTVTVRMGMLTLTNG